VPSGPERAESTGSAPVGSESLAATASTQAWLDQVHFDDKGLLPVIAQEKDTGDVLMLAWMNRQALEATAQLKRAVYFSRSRGKLWFKGEESGHVQWVHEMRLDCDSDVLLLTVTQQGHTPSIACHTGRHSCFSWRLDDSGAWVESDPVLKDPQAIYTPPQSS
jgi:phosphoribosyl-AMP cyclohydrolase